MNPELPAPDHFIQDPGRYLGSVSLLQEKVFDLGKFALERLEREDDCHVLPLPPTPPAVGHLQAEHMRGLFLENFKMTAAVIEGQSLLLKAYFCHERYNIIVVDDQRGHVLKVVPIDLSRLTLLSTLLEEAISYCGVFLEWALLEEISKDINEVIRLILHDLSLSSLIRSPTISVWDNLLHTCHLTSCTLMVLFLGMVSFVTSHACVGSSTEEAILLETLCIETDNGFIYMAPRHLSCLDAFTKSSIWGFSSSSTTLIGVETGEPPSYNLSTFLVDFSDLWGPLGLRYVNSSKHLIDQVTVRGGTITMTTTNLPKLS
jgi:hypothetical protein